MALHIYRVVVRGHFYDLDPDQRSALLAATEDHTIFKSAFTPDGTFTYEANLVAFNFRYECRIQDDQANGHDPEALAIDESLGRARDSLAGWGIEHRHLRATAADMASMWT